MKILPSEIPKNGSASCFVGRLECLRIGLLIILKGVLTGSAYVTFTFEQQRTVAQNTQDMSDEVSHE